MDFLPILSTLRRHKTAAVLIVLEIAFTCAIVCNAIFLIRGRLSRMDRQSGVAENELINIRLTGIGKKADAAAVTAQDLVALRAIPGVKSVAATNMVPFVGSSSWNSSITATPDAPESRVTTGMYLGSPDLIETLGVKLVAGRDFLPEEYADAEAVNARKAKVSSVLLTRKIAERLFPGQSALGQSIYLGTEQMTVVGIIDRLARPNEFDVMDQAEYSMVLPMNVTYALGRNYLLRVDPARRAEVLAAVDTVLDKVDPRRIILARQTFAEIRTDHFKQDSAMAHLLTGVCIALLIITALGIVGLASFWVQQRTRQIGIRRAIGATRGDILRYFQLENFILATLGIVLGMILAYGLNQVLMTKSQVERLPSSYLPIGAALLWLLGQLAVLGPALRASMIPPAIATRSV